MKWDYFTKPSPRHISIAYGSMVIKKIRGGSQGTYTWGDQNIWDMKRTCIYFSWWERGQAFYIKKQGPTTQDKDMVENEFELVDLEVEDETSNV